MNVRKRKQPSLEKTSWETVVFYEEPNKKKKKSEDLDQKRGAGYRGVHC